MVDQRRLPDPSPGNNGNDVYILICPRIIQGADILLSTKQIGSGNGNLATEIFLTALPS